MQAGPGHNSNNCAFTRLPKGVYVKNRIDLARSSRPDFRLQSGAPADRMRHRNALVSIARLRHLDRCGSSVPNGRARYVHRVDICVRNYPPA